MEISLHLRCSYNALLTSSTSDYFMMAVSFFERFVLTFFLKNILYKIIINVKHGTHKNNENPIFIFFKETADTHTHTETDRKVDIADPKIHNIAVDEEVM